jgi:hypothetical protein
MKILPVGDIKIIRNVKVGDEDRTETLIIERWFFKNYCEIIGSVIKLGIGEYDLTGGTLLIGGKKFTDWSKIDTDEVEYSISGTEKQVDAKNETPLLTTPFTPAMYNKIPVVKLAKRGIHGIGSLIRNVMHPEADESENAPDDPPKTQEIVIPDNIKIDGGADSLAMQYAIIQEKLKASTDMNETVKLLLMSERITKKSRSTDRIVVFRDTSAMMIIDQKCE